MSKKTKDCPYLWEVLVGDEITYVFAETPSEALKEVEKEFSNLDEVHLTIICFANEILNYK